jgi:AcrR family transcriptional regulator
MSEKSTSPRKRLPAAEAQERILEAAQKRLAEDGPDGLRLQDVAADLGISHPAILHHFGNRDGLIRALEGRAMRALQDDLLSASDPMGPHGPALNALDRVARTLGDEGHARVLAWWVLHGGGGTDQAWDWGMLRDLADGIHARQAEAARAEGRPEPDPKETVFVVRLAAAALFGEALLGDILSRSAGMEDPAEASQEFRRWFAELLDR